MKSRSLILWIVAVLLTAGGAVYQRMTGPTYPLRGEALVGETRVPYRLDRSEEQRNALVRIPAVAADLSGWIEWKRHKTADPWVRVPMERSGEFLTAEIPVQPPAGKLDYRVVLERGGAQGVIPADGPAVIRFKGNVPAWVLFPHIFVMFLAMLFSTRAGLEIFSREPNVKNLTLWTILFLLLGGMILGPIMQKYAFGAYWTGWPFGIDLTDNKTVVAVLAWLVAAWGMRRSARPARWAVGAAVVLFVVYLIPHSVLGSEIDYTKEAARSPAAGKAGPAN
jgi:hypothetical protein